jgi:hypothetical protein
MEDQNMNMEGEEKKEEGMPEGEKPEGEGMEGENANM